MNNTLDHPKLLFIYCEYKKLFFSSKRYPVILWYLVCDDKTLMQVCICILFYIEKYAQIYTNYTYNIHFGLKG